MFFFRKKQKKRSEAPEFMEFEGLRFQIRRVPRKRSLSISIRPNGVARISAPVTCSKTHLEAFLHEKRAWIHEAVSHFHQIREKHPPLIVRDKIEIPFLGEMRPITIERSPQKVIRLKIVERFFTLQVPNQISDLESPAVQEKLRHTLRLHYKKLAIELLSKRVSHWSKVTGFQPTGLSFRGQKTRWGSCSPSGAISLNWKLICASPALIDYVIIHELCHLKHLDHSKNFWRQVEVFCPDWKERKKRLHGRGFEVDFLNKTSELHDI